MSPLPRVYPILDTGSLARLNFPIVETAEAFLEGGAQILQFRHKSSWDQTTFNYAQQIADLCQQANARFIVNDRADFAHLLNAGLHLGQEDLTPADARKITGPDTLIGYSTHNPGQMLAAAQEPADYVAFGPIFTTASKLHPDPDVGIEGLRAIRPLTPKPLVAIGGITRDNASSCWAAGADSVAIIADLYPSPCTKRAVRERMNEWHRISSL